MCSFFMETRLCCALRIAQVAADRLDPKVRKDGGATAVLLMVMLPQLLKLVSYELYIRKKCKLTFLYIDVDVIRCFGFVWTQEKNVIKKLKGIEDLI